MLRTACLAGLIAAGGVAAAGEPSKLWRGLAAPFEALHREPPVPRRPPAGCDDLDRLADQLDWLEHHIATHGSIVAKEPDVWGQNRLMRHRHEYEEQMRRQLDAFELRSQAAIRRSDEAFLSMALAFEQATDRRRAAEATAPAKPHEFAPLALPAVETPPALEPTIHLDQLSRYLNHLHELRRINEGDDSADAPGYSLNLVRLPVSVTPGAVTAAGHGAEITVTISPCLEDTLLPATFRNLVVNDLIDLVAPGLTFCVNDPECLAWAATILAPPSSEPAARQGVLAAMRGLQARLPAIAPATAPALKTRRARMPLPFSQLGEVSGVRQIAILVHDAHVALVNHPSADPCIPYALVRRFLGEELEAADDFLAQERQRPLWHELAGWNLAELVRSRRIDDLARIRCHVFTQIGAGGDASETSHITPLGDGVCCDERLQATPVCRTTTAVLAWGILVESALLNERLVEDIRESGAGTECTGPFFGPDPAPEARAAFNDYVRRRWPIRVFALDPVTQEQNVDDAFASRRELQVAMAMAFASGRMSAQSVNRFARRLDTEISTVALNRTIVGFSHGADTFGWRFHPRVQTPPPKGTLAAFGETLCGPSPAADRGQRRLEEGQRECAAIVVMPSFVPALTLDVSTRWFSLACPGKTQQSLRQTMHLSRAVQAIRSRLDACGPSSGLYRAGDAALLMRRLDQLDRCLPLQTLTARVPMENACGGFELFNAGVTDLAPELVGWYGAPGVDPAGTTTLFLVGKGFSVHDTSVIAGGKPVTCRLVSREVLEARIPPGLASTGFAGRPPRPFDSTANSGRARLMAYAAEPLPPPALDLPPPPPGPAPACPTCCDLDCNRREVVEIHLATPYGVSSPLLVPVARRQADAACGLVFAPGFDVRLTFTTTKTVGSRSESAKVDEFFAATADALVIHAPPVFVPPPKGSLRIVAKDATTGVTAASFSLDALTFDAARHAYVIAGGELRNLVGDTSRPATDKTLRGALKPYLDSRLALGELAAEGDGIPFTLSAWLVAEQQEIPVAGTLSAIATRRGKTSIEPRSDE